jgi:phospholipase C
MRTTWQLGVLALVLAALSATVVAISAQGSRAVRTAQPEVSAANDVHLRQIKHFVVIYEENHSFDNLYGGWEGVNGLANADADHTTQRNQAGMPFQCLYMDDINLQAMSAANPTAPLSSTCTDTTTATPFPSHFTNAPFKIDDFLTPTDTTCPPNPLVAFSSANGFKNGTGSPGGCTRDLVHRFYQEQFQLHGGAQDRYILGSDAGGLTMGYYDTKALPLYEYLHEQGHPHYAILDNFFQAAFGGSFLNHQWLIAAASPVCNAANGCPTAAPLGPATHSVLDANGFPQLSYPPASNRPPGMGPLYVSPTASGLVDGPLTQSCGLSTTIAGLACGDFGVNTMQPPYAPSGAFGAVLPAQTNPTIGDRLTANDIDWAWYAGGWSNANGDVGAPGWTNGSSAASTPTGCLDPYVDPSSRGGVPVAHWPICPDNLFQYHHQPFNYFLGFSRNTDTGKANRTAHLKDEQEFIQLANDSGKECKLKPVSFVKPFGTENEHPGYASEPDGSDHLVDLLKSIENGACAKDTMVIVTYDEFGGQWDHVSPPGQGNENGPHDVWGPGTRIPAVVLAPHLAGPFVVDSTEHDTTSILATLEHRYGLDPLGTRDAAVADLSSAFIAKQPKTAEK